MILLLCFATLRERPIDPDVLRHFSLDVVSRGRQFSREVRIAATLRALLSMGCLVWLSFHPAGARLMERLERMGGRRRWWLGLSLVAAGVVFLASLVELPFTYYIGYWHEKAYGLTRQSPLQWLGNHAIDTTVDLVLSILLWIPVYWMIRRWPRRWWAPAALMQFLFAGLLAMLAPILLIPMEGPTVPVRDPKVMAMVHQLAARAGVEVGTVQEMLISQKSSRVNAMVTGLGQTKRMILYDTLLQQFKPKEVEVVIAHEMSHAIHRDVAVGWLVAGITSTFIFFLTERMLGRMVGVGPLQIAAPHAARSLVLFLLLGTLLGELVSPVHNMVSRRMEVRADQFALELTGNRTAFIAAFRKLAEGNPGDVDPPTVVEFLSHSHPSIMNRIRMATGQAQSQ